MKDQEPGVNRFAVWTMDGLACLFLVRLLIPFIDCFFAGYKLQGIIFPIWLLLAILSGRKTLVDAIVRTPFIVVAATCFGLFGLLSALLHHGAAAKVHAFFFLSNTFPCLLLGLYYGSHPNRFWRICKFALALLGINAAYSIPRLLNDVFIVRNIMLGIVDPWDAARSGVGIYELYTSSALLVPLVVALCLSTSSLIARSAWAGAVAALILANSASTLAFASLISIMGAGAVFVFGVLRNRFKILTAIALMVLVGAASFTALKQANTETFDFVIDKVASIFDGVKEGGIVNDPTSRGERLAWSLKLLAESPIFGSGPTAGVETGISENSYRGHSTWLDMLIEYGIFGAACYYFVVINVGRTVWRGRRAAKGDLAGDALLIGFIAFCVTGVLDTVFPMRSFDIVLFFVLFGGGLAMQAKQAVPTSKRNNSRPKKARASKFDDAPVSPSPQ